MMRDSMNLESKQELLLELSKDIFSEEIQLSTPSFSEKYLIRTEGNLNQIN